MEKTERGPERALPNTNNSNIFIKETLKEKREHQPSQHESGGLETTIIFGSLRTRRNPPPKTQGLGSLPHTGPGERRGGGCRGEGRLPGLGVRATEVPKCELKQSLSRAPCILYI